MQVSKPGGATSGGCGRSFAPLGPRRRRAVLAGPVGSAGPRRHGEATRGEAGAGAVRTGGRGPAGPRAGRPHPVCPTPESQPWGLPLLELVSRAACEGLSGSHLTVTSYLLPLLAST